MLFQEILIHDFSRTLRDRALGRTVAGPYRWRPAETNKGRGFYCDDVEQCGDGPIRLRLEDANAHICGRLAYTTGYYCDPDCDGDTLQPIIARLPRGRGFLAGWKMGPDMAASLAPEIYADETAAAYAAHSIAEYDAEANRERQLCNACGAPACDETPEGLPICYDCAEDAANDDHE